MKGQQSGSEMMFCHVLIKNLKRLKPPLGGKKKKKDIIS